MSNFTSLKAPEITYNNFEILRLVFMPNMTTNHAIIYTNKYCYYCTFIPLDNLSFSSCKIKRKQYRNFVLSYYRYNNDDIKVEFVLS